MPETAALLQMLALLLGVGACAGLVAGLLGVGGESCWFPHSFMRWVIWAMRAGR